MIKKHALIGLLIMSSLGSNFSQAGIFDNVRMWWNGPSYSKLGAGETLVPLCMVKSANEYVYAISHKDDSKRSFSYIRRLIYKKVMPEKTTEKIFLLQSSKRHFRFPDQWVETDRGTHVSSTFTFLNTKDVKKELSAFKTFDFLGGELVKDVHCGFSESEFVCYLLLKTKRMVSTPNGLEESINLERGGGVNTPIFSRDDQSFIEVLTDVIIGKGEDDEDEFYSLSDVTYLLVKKLNLRTGECENIAFKDLSEDVRKRFSK